MFFIFSRWFNVCSVLLVFVWIYFLLLFINAPPRALASRMNTHSIQRPGDRHLSLGLALPLVLPHSFSLMSIDTLTFSVVSKTFQRCGLCGFRPRQRHRAMCTMLCADSFNYVSDSMQWYCLMRLSVHIIVRNASQGISELLLLFFAYSGCDYYNYYCGIA